MIFSVTERRSTKTSCRDVEIIMVVVRRHSAVTPQKTIAYKCRYVRSSYVASSFVQNLSDVLPRLILFPTQIRQPQSMVNYTSTGFKKIKAPKKVFDLLKTHWEMNKHLAKAEVWSVGNVYGTLSVTAWRGASFLVLPWPR